MSVLQTRWAAQDGNQEISHLHFGIDDPVEVLLTLLVTRSSMTTCSQSPSEKLRLPLLFASFMGFLTLSIFYERLFIRCGALVSPLDGFRNLCPQALRFAFGLLRQRASLDRGGSCVGGIEKDILLASLDSLRSAVCTLELVRGQT